MNNTRELRCLLNSKEAAKFLSVSPRTLWSLTFERTPGVPYFRIGHSVRYSQSDLLAWLGQQTPNQAGSVQ